LFFIKELSVAVLCKVRGECKLIVDPLYDSKLCDGVFAPGRSNGLDIII